MPEYEFKLAVHRQSNRVWETTKVVEANNQKDAQLVAESWAENAAGDMDFNQFGEADGIQVSALMYAALILMLLTFVVNVMAQWVVRRLSLKY